MVVVDKHPVVAKAEELGEAIKASGNASEELLLSLNHLISEKTKIDYGSVARSGCGGSCNC